MESQNFISYRRPTWTHSWFHCIK